MTQHIAVAVCHAGSYDKGSYDKRTLHIFSNRPANRIWR
jgi:hypothetical protein